MILISIPFFWGEHEQPYDYARYSSFGLKSLLEEHGFELIRHEKNVNHFNCLLQLFIEYMRKRITTRFFYWNLVLAALVYCPLNCMSIILSYILPNDDDMFLDQIVLAKKNS